MDPTSSGCTSCRSQKQQTAQLNWERFNSPADWALVQQAGTTPLTDTARLNSIYSQLEKDFLQQLPQIPVWYNGAWFQGNTKYWTNYPSSTAATNQTIPVMWNGYIGAMTSVYGAGQPDAGQASRADQLRLSINH